MTVSTPCCCNCTQLQRRSVCDLQMQGHARFEHLIPDNSVAISHPTCGSVIHTADTGPGSRVRRQVFLRTASFIDAGLQAELNLSFWVWHNFSTAVPDFPPATIVQRAAAGFWKDVFASPGRNSQPPFLPLCRGPVVAQDVYRRRRHRDCVRSRHSVPSVG